MSDSLTRLEARDQRTRPYGRAHFRVSWAALAEIFEIHNRVQLDESSAKHMTPYHEYFLPIFLLGCSIAAIASFFAGRMSACLVPGVLLTIGVVVLWAAMFIGSDLGYRAWQSMPDAPDEAFSDASAVGALVLGWLPAGVFCLTVFGLVRVLRRLWRWAIPDASPQIAMPDSNPVETGNPYQGPGAG